MRRVPEEEVKRRMAGEEEDARWGGCPKLESTSDSCKRVVCESRSGWRDANAAATVRPRLELDNPSETSSEAAGVQRMKAESDWREATATISREAASRCR